MLYYNRIDVSEGIDKQNKCIKKCEICHYWYVLKKTFRFQPYVSNRCHDLLMMSMNLSDIAILKIKMSIFVVLLLELAKVKLKINCKILI